MHSKTSGRQVEAALAVEERRSTEPSQLPAGVEDRLQQALASALPPGLLPPDQRGKVISIIEQVVEEEVFSGPAPHPRMLAEYDLALPGSANRVLTIAEKEQSHRHWWEKVALVAEIGLNYLGQILGFLVSLALMYGAFKSAEINQPVVACAFLAASAVGMVSVFVTGRRPKMAEKGADEVAAKPEAKPRPKTPQKSVAAKRNR